MNKIGNGRWVDEAAVPLRSNVDVGADQCGVEVETVRDLYRKFEQFGL